MRNQTYGKQCLQKIIENRKLFSIVFATKQADYAQRIMNKLTRTSDGRLYFSKYKANIQERVALIMDFMGTRKKKIQTKHRAQSPQSNTKWYYKTANIDVMEQNLCALHNLIKADESKVNDYGAMFGQNMLVCLACCLHQIMWQTFKWLGKFDTHTHKLHSLMTENGLRSRHIFPSATHASNPVLVQLRSAHIASQQTHIKCSCGNTKETTPIELVLSINQFAKITQKNSLKLKMIGNHDKWKKTVFSTTKALSTHLYFTCCAAPWLRH